MRVHVLDVRPKDRHLLLMVDDGRPLDRRFDATGRPTKFLCGHDERHWFVAGVSRRVSSVAQAKDALLPGEALVSLARSGEKARRRHRRRNAAFVRQGEWFFIPAPRIDPPAWLILSNEPLQRGGGKPHVAELLYRFGGEMVYVCPEYPNGLTESAYARLLQRSPAKKRLAWRTMRRGMAVCVKGRIRHPDHKTVVLRRWHRVVPNREHASERVVFLD